MTNINFKSWVISYLQYLEDEHHYQTFIVPLAQHKATCAVGSATNGKIILLDETFVNEDSPCAFASLEHITGHGQQLRAGQDKMFEEQNVQYDALGRMNDAAQSAKFSDIKNTSLANTCIGLGMVYDAFHKGYFSPDTKLEDLHHYSEVYYAMDAKQYAACVTSGDIPRYGLTPSKDLNLEPYRLSPTPVELFPPRTDNPEFLIMHVLPRTAPPSIKFTTAYSRKITQAVQRYNYRAVFNL